MGNINCTFEDVTCFPWLNETVQRRPRKRQEVEEEAPEMQEGGIDVNLWRHSWMRKNALANKLYNYCEHDHADGIQNLCVEHGALKYINYLNKEGVAPLHIACTHGSKNAVLVLLAHGADAGLKTAGGVSPIQIAREANEQEIVDILLRVRTFLLREDLTSSQHNPVSSRVSSARGRLDSLDESSSPSSSRRARAAGGEGSPPASARE